MEDLKTTDKKEEILDVAEKLFSDNGFEAVSVREISKAANINVAMVSYYFGSKEKMYEEVINRKLISFDAFRSKIEMLPTYKERLFIMVDVFVDKFFERRQFQNIIFREMAMNQRTVMADKISTKLHQNFSFISDIIQKGIKHKEFKKVDIELTVMSIIGIVRMYITSGTMACKILQLDSESDAFDQKQKNRLRKHLRELLTNHLEIKQ